MKISSKFVSVLLISALAASMALAQGQRGGQGGGRGGQQMSELRILGRKDVQKDLGLTDDQVTKIEEYTTKNQPQRGAGGGGGNGGGGNGGGGGGQRGNGGGGQGGGAQTDEQRAAAAKLAAERREKTRKDLLEIISEAQMKRVGEIMLQLQGFNAIGQPEMQKALDMSADQIAKVKDLQAKQREASMALFQKMRDGELTQEDMRAATTKNTETMKTELGKILTEKQIASFKAMQGKTFVADEPGN
jgi:hypothetical protein